MNIDDVKQVDIPEGCLWAAMFDHQIVLAIKYDEIERRNIGYHAPVTWVVRDPLDLNRQCRVRDEYPSLDDTQFQNWIKNFFWRTTEELAEALEMGEPSDKRQWQRRWDADTDLRHYFEEVADALHFLIEVSAYVGMESQHVALIWKKASHHFDPSATELAAERLSFLIIQHLGLAANCLKNKPWKNTHMPTDQIKFLTHFHGAWEWMCDLLLHSGLSLEDVYRLYMKKNQVNKFRQDTNY